MEKLIAFLACALVIAAITGCASTGTIKSITVTYYSDPPGASLYSGGKYMGVTPIALSYGIGKNTCNGVQPIRLLWASGAEANETELRVCQQTGKYQQFTFSRPTDVPGRATDVQIGMQSQRNAAEAAARSDDAAWEAIQSISDSSTKYIESTQSKTVNCTSELVLGKVQTTCR